MLFVGRGLLCFPAEIRHWGFKNAFYHTKSFVPGNQLQLRATRGTAECFLSAEIFCVFQLKYDTAVAKRARMHFFRRDPPFHILFRS